MDRRVGDPAHRAGLPPLLIIRIDTQTCEPCTPGLGATDADSLAIWPPPQNGETGARGVPRSGGRPVSAP